MDVFTFVIIIDDSLVLYRNIDQTILKSLHGRLNCEIGGLDCRVITTEYRTRVHYIHMFHLFLKAPVHVIYSKVSGQYSHTIVDWSLFTKGNSDTRDES